MRPSRIDSFFNRLNPFKLPHQFKIAPKHKMSEAKEKTPWKDGFWGADSDKYRDKGDMMIVKGSVVHGISMAEFVQYYAEFGQYYAGFETHETIGKYGKCTFGEFGKASTELELEKFSHISQCNLKMALDQTF